MTARPGIDRLLVGLVVILWWSAETHSATNPRSGADAGRQPTAKTPLPLEQATKDKANALVDEHLPELRAVLKRLAEDQPREYERAIGDLARSAKKLEAARNRDERLWDLEVELLKAQTQVNLLTARLKVRDSQPDRKRLRQSAERLVDAQIARAGYEVEMLQSRLERTQKQLDAAKRRLEAKQNNPEDQIEKSYRSLLRKAGREKNQK